MSEDRTVQHDRAGSATPSMPGFFSAPVCAVTAFTLAVLALLGQNVVSLALSAVLEARPGSGGSSYYLGWGIATAVQAGVALLLARQALGPGGRWEATVGRAAVLLAGIALAAAAVMVVASLLTEGSGPF